MLCEFVNKSWKFIGWVFGEDTIYPTDSVSILDVVTTTISLIFSVCFVVWWAVPLRLLKVHKTRFHCKKTE